MPGNKRHESRKHLTKIANITNLPSNNEYDIPSSSDSGSDDDNDKNNSPQLLNCNILLDELRAFEESKLVSTLDKKTKREIRDEIIPRFNAQDFTNALESLSERVEVQAQHTENKSPWSERFDMVEKQTLDAFLAKERIHDSPLLNKVVGCVLWHAYNALIDKTGKTLDSLEEDLKDAIQLQFAHLDQGCQLHPYASACSCLG